MDLAAYFARIGWQGRAEPTIDTLRALHLLHPQAIPFENLDPLRGAPVALALPALEAKLVAGGRGGYCFEHNLLLREALLAIGFRVRALAARVVWNQAAGVVTPRSHMLLQIALGGEDYITDVGFGGQVLTAPLRLDLRLEQATPHGLFRLFEAGGVHTLEARIAGAWQPLYRFDLHEQDPVDYVPINYYLSTSPASHFTTGLLAARIDGDRRLALRNAALAIHHPGETERRTIGSAAELRELLRTAFAITVPDDPALDAALERLVT